MGELIGYARVSTDEQNLDLQLDALRKHGVKDRFLFQEHMSGRSRDRPKLEECLRTIRDGDSLVVWKLDRLGRSLKDLAAITGELEERKIHFVSLTDFIDISSAAGTFTFHVLAAAAQFESDNISQRTKAGMAARAARGKKNGGSTKKLSPKQHRLLLDMKKSGDYSVNEIANFHGISRASVHRYVNMKPANSNTKEKNAA